MQRKELNKKIKEFSHKINFYKLGLIRKYIKKQYKEERKLINAIPKVICPKCGSHNISVEHDERDYVDDSWLYCNDCDEDFEDTFGYINANNELDALAWCDIIAIELHFEDPDTKTEQWKTFCETEIKKYLGMIKSESINF